jgi:hypothetical protein
VDATRAVRGVPEKDLGTWAKMFGGGNIGAQ